MAVLFDLAKAAALVSLFCSAFSFSACRQAELRTCESAGWEREINNHFPFENCWSLTLFPPRWKGSFSRFISAALVGWISGDWEWVELVRAYWFPHPLGDRLRDSNDSKAWFSLVIDSHKLRPARKNNDIFLRFPSPVLELVYVTVFPSLFHSHFCFLFFLLQSETSPLVQDSHMRLAFITTLGCEVTGVNLCWGWGADERRKLSKNKESEGDNKERINCCLITFLLVAKSFFFFHFNLSSCPAPPFHSSAAAPASLVYIVGTSAHFWWAKPSGEPNPGHASSVILISCARCGWRRE